MANEMDLSAEPGDNLSSPTGGQTQFEDAPPARSASKLSVWTKKHTVVLLAIGVIGLVALVAILKKNSGAVNSPTSADSATQAAGSGANSSDGGSNGQGFDLVGLQDIMNTNAANNAAELKAMQDQLDAENKAAAAAQAQANAEIQGLNGQISSLNGTLAKDLASIDSALAQHQSSGGGSGHTSATHGGTITQSPVVSHPTSTPQPMQKRVTARPSAHNPVYSHQEQMVNYNRIKAVQTMRNPDFAWQQPNRHHSTNTAQSHPRPYRPTWVPRTFATPNRDAHNYNARGRNRPI